ncbi:MAG: putative Enoyl-CoA hydratase [Polaromonas sp.]|nr:putative Enoyl-CoA hydratase [Polaromonas sp.]
MHVVFNRPERRNALTCQMYSALCELLDRAAQDENVKVLMLSGASSVFTAGQDLDDLLRHPPEDADAPAFQFMRRMAAFSKPLVAAVEGLAFGIGTTLLLHCDLVYVAQDSRFALPFVNLGLVPEAGSSLLLPRACGHQRAAEKLLFGDLFMAAQALELGFVNRVLPSADVLYYAARQAERLAQLPAGSVCGTKALMKGQEAPGASRAADEVALRIKAEAGLFVQRVTGPAALEAVRAFKEKRKPDFMGMD